jgi:hypothetical protein
LEFRAALLADATKASLIRLAAALAYRAAFHVAILLACAAKERENDLIRARTRLPNISLKQLATRRTRRAAAGTAGAGSGGAKSTAIGRARFTRAILNGFSFGEFQHAIVGARRIHAVLNAGKISLTSLSTSKNLLLTSLKRALTTCLRIQTPGAAGAGAGARTGARTLTFAAFTGRAAHSAFAALSSSPASRGGIRPSKQRFGIRGTSGEAAQPQSRNQKHRILRRKMHDQASYERAS